jgi:hypothetical protein
MVPIVFALIPTIVGAGMPFVKFYRGISTEGER